MKLEPYKVKHDTTRGQIFYCCSEIYNRKLSVLNPLLTSVALAPIPHLPTKLNMCPLKTLDFQMYTYTSMSKYIQRRPDSQGILGVLLKCQAMVKKTTQFVRSTRKAFNDKTPGRINNLAR